MEDRLSKFAHLVDAGSFTRAAEGLHISQPALSMAIHKLERELASQLYVRGSQPLAATSAGLYAYKAAKEVGASVRYLQKNLDELAYREISLAIGMIDSAADIVLAQNKSLRTLENQAKVSLVINNSRYLLQALERGEIDVAFVVEQARPYESRVQVQRIGSEPLVVAAHHKQLPAIARQIAEGTLTSFVGYDHPSYTYATIHQFFEERHVALSPQFYSSSPDVIQRLMMAQKGAAALPYGRIRTSLRRQVVCPVPVIGDAIITRHITCAHRQNYVLPQVIQATIAQLSADLQTMCLEASDI
ncbi:MAG: LysR family transcriptional regulator [Candidatus Saccharibacteria bacterium]